MATLPRKLTLAALLLVGALTAGCQLMAIPYFFLPGMDPKEEASCPLVSKEKDKTVRVLILSQASLETRPEFLRVDRDLAQMLAQAMADGFKKNKEKVVLVKNSQIEMFKDEHPNWKAMGAVEIGRQFKADYVIELTVNQISLYEPGSYNTFFRGRCDISLVTHDTLHSSEGPIWRKEYSTEYPKARGPIDAGTNGNVAQFRQQFLTVVARELSWNFTSHLTEDDYKMEQ
jgi:hypothetical protein